VATQWKIGDRIAYRWEIQRILGGGMGVVYIVYDPRSKLPLAVKTFQDEIFARDPNIAEMFTREALACIKLEQHQNITRAHNVEIIQGKPLLFLDYISGGDLTGWIGTRRLLDLRQVLRFALQFCDGMVHARSKGLTVHRDIKPQNCLVTEDGVLKITDFGLAKVLDGIDLPLFAAEVAAGTTTGSDRAAARLSRTGGMAGTPHYMAPEQFIDAKHVDVRADVYSFGVMLFEMATGGLPFDGRDLRDLQHQHARAPLPAMPLLPAELKAVVRTCMAKDAVARYADFSAAREQLGRAYRNLTGEEPPQPVTGRELDSFELVNKGYALVKLGRPEEGLQSYDRAIEAIPENAFAWSNKAAVLSGLQRDDEAVVCCQQAVDLAPTFALAWANMGISLGRLDRLDEALSCHQRALHLDPDNPVLWLDMGHFFQLAKRGEDALLAFDRALGFDPENTTFLNDKGACLIELGRNAEALPCFELVVQIDPEHAMAWSNRGKVLSSLGDRDTALRCFERSLQINPRQAAVWTNRGTALADLGRLEDALGSHVRALELDPRFGIAWHNKGDILQKLGRTTEALSCFDRALEIDPRRKEHWFSKGTLLIKLDRLLDAARCFDFALELDPNDADTWQNKGACLGRLGRSAEALQCYDRAVALDPTNANNWYVKGMLSLATRTDEGLAALDRACSLGDFRAAEALANIARQAQQAQHPGPLSFSQLLNELDRNPAVSVQRLVDLHGVDFELSVATEACLRDAGADDGLVRACKSNRKASG